eukprot:CAMPEP_0116018874 /NCGR_PEP_ID=MMETSP0321-20121206/8899_1 /TAXON_ID=163516 /ORGANISM="Leptocylindrus danicus var. danicus, Strain B650" /LENGTH=83 /DNA_ID=CAMNT_0003489333 /DNA_START=167 /DNA_END=418 /DNA_ORIENTATION=+
MATQPAVKSLYRSLAREAKRLSDYNFRTYAIRRVKKGFELNRNLAGLEINAAIEDGKRQLDMLKRQSTIGQMYPGATSVMEKQ